MLCIQESWIDKEQMLLRFRFNNSHYRFRTESFGGLLFCRRDLSVFYVGPFAAKVLTLCRGSTTIQEILQKIVEEANDFPDIKKNVDFFLSKMLSAGVLTKESNNNGPAS